MEASIAPTKEDSPGQQAIKQILGPLLKVPDSVFPLLERFGMGSSNDLVELKRLAADPETLHTKLVEWHLILSTVIKADHDVGIGTTTIESSGHPDLTATGQNGEHWANQVGEIGAVGDTLSDVHAEVPASQGADR